jgi:LmbE family N-acetylglucosaminyl deacetylase
MLHRRFRDGSPRLGHVLLRDVTLRGFALSLFALLLAAVPGAAQDLGPSTGGMGALDQALRFLGHHKRVLMIAAHPDDEDTELLTVLVRGMGAEAAYLSLTRGEGGQNLIGSELGPALGVLRTGELLAARTLDGARQFFTRAYDFGFSKTAEDTWRFWPRDSVLKDAVRVIRRYRPQVMVSIFSGTPRDGHGQHQASGWVALEAFRVAGDSSVFPELSREEGLAPWTPLKLYRSARFEPGATALTLPGGVLDPAVGQSFRQIAMRGRSLHRSQDMGALQPLGPSFVRLTLVEDRTGQGREGFFAGVDTTLASLAARPLDPSARQAVDSLAAGLRALRPWAAGALPALRRRFTDLFSADDTAPPAVADQLARLHEAEFLASGVVCDALATAARVVAAARVGVILSCWNTSRDTVTVTARLVIGGEPRDDAVTRRVGPGVLVADTLWWRVPEDTPPTQPYYLRQPRDGALYRWPGGPVAGLPFEPPYLAAEFSVNGARRVQEVVHRTVDQALGEVRRPVPVVPRVSLALTPDLIVWPEADTGVRLLTVTVRNLGQETWTGRVGIEAPPGWSVEASRVLELPPDGAPRVERFTLRQPRPAAPGTVGLRAVAVDGAGRRDSTGITMVEYPHVRARQLVQPAEVRLVVAPVALPRNRTVGYVRGAADGVPEILTGLGFRVVLLGPDSLAYGDLSRFPTIVIGPRAWEAEPALTEHNARLLAFVRGGGTLVVQYQQHLYFNGDFAPYPLRVTDGPGAGGRVSAPRVSEEDAVVRLLDVAHPAFSVPNRLGPDDWQGWVQERGLYVARSWSGPWTPLLEMADTGEPPLQGSLLVAPVGRGLYVYTGLSFFRQLPAGNTGAVRLFVNLLALEGPDGP